MTSRPQPETDRRMASFNRTQADQLAFNAVTAWEAADRSTASLERRAARINRGNADLRRMNEHLMQLADADLYDASHQDRNSTDADRVRANAAGRIIAGRMERGEWTLGLNAAGRRAG